jgi:hypothetical protein
MKYLIAVFFAVLTGLGISQPQQTITKFDEVENAANKKVNFKSGKVYETNLFEIEFIGQLQSTQKADFLILAGRQCEECDANISIYIHSPSDGPLQDEAYQPRYGFPGKVFYYEDNRLVYESRTFWGEVLPKRFGVIWFQKQLTDKNEWVESVFFAELLNDKIEDKTVKATIDQLVDQVKKGTAWEIKGRDQTSEP